VQKWKLQNQDHDQTGFVLRLLSDPSYCAILGISSTVPIIFREIPISDSYPFNKFIWSAYHYHLPFVTLHVACSLEGSLSALFLLFVVWGATFQEVTSRVLQFFLRCRSTESLSIWVKSLCLLFLSLRVTSALIPSFSPAVLGKLSYQCISSH